MLNRFDQLTGQVNVDGVDIDPGREVLQLLLIYPEFSRDFVDGPDFDMAVEYFGPF